MAYPCTMELSSIRSGKNFGVILLFPSGVLVSICLEGPLFIFSNVPSVL